MRIGRCGFFLLAAALLLSGCAGFWAPLSSSSSGGCTTSCSSASSGDFYILNAPSSGTPQIVGEQIVSGKLTAISGSPWTVPATPYAMVAAGSYLYVSTLSGVYVYPISSGALGTYKQVTTDVALAIQVDPSGAWLVEAEQASASGGVTIAAIPLNSSTGLSSGSESTTTANISNATVQNGKMVMSGDDDYIFVALGPGGTIIVPFNANAASGSSPFGTSAYNVSVANSGGSALSVAVDPSLDLFYIGESLANSGANSGGIRAIEYKSIGSTLVQATGSPIASGGTAPNAIFPTASNSIYVANGAGTSSAGTINGFTITSSGTNYTIGAGSSVASGIQPYGLAEDSTNTYVLAINSLGGPYFSSYTFDSTTTGKLDEQVFANTGTSPIAIVAP